MIVAGVMSGTSADGIDVALVRIGSSGHRHRIRLLGHYQQAYPLAVRRTILGVMNSRANVADLARLNFFLGELYAEAIRKAEKKLHVKAALAGCHGQTIYHQGNPKLFLGRRIGATWQTGEGAVVAARLGIPVVSDFRPADMALGGKGAPLVPYLDYLLYADQHKGRIVQNIGGIANLTAIAAGAEAGNFFAFDTGPGNMVIDALASRLYGKPFDKDGKIASSGRFSQPVISRCLKMPFFIAGPPKTAGREEFGRAFVSDFLRLARGLPKADVVATATALTAQSIAGAIRRFVLPRGRFAEVIVSGGGARNPALMAGLANELSQLGLQLRFSDEFGIPAEAKEAVAFALLAYETWHRRPSNVPKATGAKSAAVLGKISYA